MSHRQKLHTPMRIGKKTGRLGSKMTHTAGGKPGMRKRGR